MGNEANPRESAFRTMARRQFLGRSSIGVGAVALSSLLTERSNADTTSMKPPFGPHFPPRATRVIWLTQAGAPSQLELFDYKPDLQNRFDQDLPDSIRQGQRLTGMTSGQKRFPITPSYYRFSPQGESGLWMSELLPHTSKFADELCIVRSMHTEAINHDPAMTLLQTGHQTAGRPAFGAWVSYGLGSVNNELPTFVAMISRPSGPTNAQPLHERMWGSGFLPTRYQGVRFSSGKDPVLFLSNPSGVNGSRRRAMLDDLSALNMLKYEDYRDPETLARIDQYEMAFRMQASVPELADLSGEPASVFEAYGPESTKPGTFAANCILARRLAERGVRFIQLYHRGWDQHNNLPSGIKSQCYDTDQPTGALLNELKQRGMFEDTLVVWGGEFGRTPTAQGDNGRDHNPHAFTWWFAGAGVRPAVSYGASDDFGFYAQENKVHVHDLHATLLHLLGIDHERLTYRYGGRDFRLTDVHGTVVRELLRG